MEFIHLEEIATALFELGSRPSELRDLKARHFNWVGTARTSVASGQARTLTLRGLKERQN
jgi:hypothetical protein